MKKVYIEQRRIVTPRFGHCTEIYVRGLTTCPRTATALPSKLEEGSRSLSEIISCSPPPAVGSMFPHNVVGGPGVGPPPH